MTKSLLGSRFVETNNQDANNTGTNGNTAPPAAPTAKVNVEVFYVHPDHLGTPRVNTASTALAATTGTGITSPQTVNKAVWRWDSDPFGSNATANSAPNENPNTLSQVVGTSTLPYLFGFDLAFPGQKRDRETGKHYNYFRNYDPALGRYVESDPIGLHGGINTYAYSKLQPCKLHDRTGLWTTGAESALAWHFFFGGGAYMDISAWCAEYLQDEQVKWAKKNLEREIDAKVRSYVGFRGTDTFQIRRNSHLYVWSIYSFGSGIGHMQDADCTVVGDGCCARATCSTTMKAIDRYSNPLDLRERFGWRNGNENLGGTVFWFGLYCSGGYGSQACSK
ncbi:MAG: RHS repeat-associated core domain-containing protein [Casimicrobium sp.]